MIIEGKDFYTTHNGVPTDQDLQSFIDTYKCMTQIYGEDSKFRMPYRFTLHWFFPYSGWYKVTINDENETIDDLKARMPDVYPI